MDGRVEDDRQVDLLARAVGVAASRLRHDPHRRHPRPHDPVHLVPGLRREGLEVDGDHPAAAARDLALPQRTARDTDPVLVEVPGLHRVAEPEGARAAARREPRRTRVASDREFQDRVAGDVYHAREGHRDLDVFLEAVGVARPRGRHDREGGLQGPEAAHPVPRIGRHAAEGPDGRVAHAVLDHAPAQGIRRDADAILVPVAFLDDVAEGQARRATARGERGIARVGADGDGKDRLAGDVDLLVEGHLDRDGLAGAVRGPRLRRGHDLHFRHQWWLEPPGVDLVRRLGGHRWHRSRILLAFWPRGVSRVVADAPALQRRRTHADAVVVEVTALHDVAEAQGPRTTAPDEIRGPRQFPHGQQQREVHGRGRDAGGDDVHDLVEDHGDFDGVAGDVRVVGSRIRGDLDARDLWRAGVDLVGTVIRQRRQRAYRRVPGLVRDRAATQGAGLDGDARRGPFGIEIPCLHDVAEGQLPRAHSEQRRRSRQGADGNQEFGRTRHHDVLVEGHLEVDVVACGIGLVLPRIRDDCPASRLGRHRVNLVVVIVRQRFRERGRHIGTLAVGQSASADRTRPEGDSIGVLIVLPDTVPEQQPPGPAAVDEPHFLLLRLLLHADRKGERNGERKAGVLGHIDRAVERHRDLDRIADRIRLVRPGIGDQRRSLDLHPGRGERDQRRGRHQGGRERERAARPRPAAGDSHRSSPARAAGCTGRPSVPNGACLQEGCAPAGADLPSVVPLPRGGARL